MKYGFVCLVSFALDTHLPQTLQGFVFFAQLQCYQGAVKTSYDITPSMIVSGVHDTSRTVRAQILPL